MEKKKVFLLLTLVVLLASMSLMPACASKPASTEITIDPALPAGTSAYAAGVVFGEAINKNSTWLKANVPEGKHPMVTMKKIVENPELAKTRFFWNSGGSIFTLNMHKGASGDPPFNTYDYNRFKYGFFHGTTGTVFVSRDPNIKTWKDLDGKKVVIGDVPGDTGSTLYTMAFKKAGVNIVPQQMKKSAMVQALKDGLIDAMYTGMSPAGGGKWKGAAALPELQAQMDIYFIQTDVKAMQATFDELGFPGYLAVVPPNQVPMQEKEVPVIGYTLFWGCHEDMDDMIVEEIMRIAYETCGTWVEHHPALGIIKPELMGLCGVPESSYHPAALKVLKEKGVRIGDYAGE